MYESILFIYSLILFSLVFYMKRKNVDLKDILLFFKINNLDIEKLLEQKDKITIYRYEKDGIGPYRSDFLDNSEKENKPTPHTDFKEIFIYLKIKNKLADFKFGFSSMSQLEEWFTKEEIFLLEKEGYELKTFKTNIFFDSGKQVIFHKPL